MLDIQLILTICYIFSSSLQYVRYLDHPNNMLDILIILIFYHRLITIQIEHYMSSFQDLWYLSFTITLRQMPKVVTRVLSLSVL